MADSLLPVAHCPWAQSEQGGKPVLGQPELFPQVRDIDIRPPSPRVPCPVRCRRPHRPARLPSPPIFSRMVSVPWFYFPYFRASILAALPSMFTSDLVRFALSFLANTARRKVGTLSLCGNRRTCQEPSHTRRGIEKRVISPTLPH